nr:ribonuclease H-like domain-containing protein [Tanacetum cinerariifolium]
MSNHEEETINVENAHPKVVPQIITVTNIFAKFPYLKKGEYDIWAMKMQNFISSSDLLCWNIVLKGNSAKSMTTDNDGNLKIRPPVTVEEHQKARFGGNAESKKMQTSLLKQKFKELKFFEEEGLDKGYENMQKILTQMNILKIKPNLEDVNMKFLRGLPPSWSGIALILKIKGGLEYISFDDLYNKLKFLEIDTKGYSSSSSTLSNATFMNKEEFEEYDVKHHMAMLSIKVHRFEKKHRQKIKFNGRENARFDKKLVKCFNCKQMGHFLRECRAQEDEVVSTGDDIPAGVSVPAGTVAAAVVSAQSETEFALMGLSTKAHKHAVKILEKQIKCHQTNQLAYEEKIRVISYELEEKSNILEYRRKLIEQAEKEKQELMTKLDNEIANQAKWNNSGENLYKLIDSFISVRTKRGLGLDKYIGEGELGIDDSKFSMFYTNSDDLEGQPIYNRFALVDHIKAVPLLLTGNYMPPSNIPDRDESQMVYGKKATDSYEIKSNDDSISHSNDSVHFGFTDRLEKAKDRGIVDSGCSRSMSGNKDKLEDFESFNGGEVTFGGSTGKISGKGTIKTKNLNFENVLYVEELQHFNLISVSQICDQSHRVFFTKNECLVLFKDFPLPDPSMVILSIPRKHNLYTFNLNELSPKGHLTCLIAKPSQNKSTLWHRRLGHVNFRNINKLVKGNLVREFCGSKRIRRDYSNARTPQQNGVAERKNQTLIEAARTMLVDSLLPTIFWSKAVVTTCYVLNR